VGLVGYLLLPSDAWQSEKQAMQGERFDTMMAYRIYDAITGRPFIPSSPDLH
jgi:hypothetical protein